MLKRTSVPACCEAEFRGHVTVRGSPGWEEKARKESEDAVKVERCQSTPSKAIVFSSEKSWSIDKFHDHHSTCYLTMKNEDVEKFCLMANLD